MAEYAVLIAVVVAALIAMQTYMSRGLSGKLRVAADSLGEQYAPKHTHTSPSMMLTMSGATKTHSTLERNRQVTTDGRTEHIDVMKTVVSIESPETTTRTGSETVDALSPTLEW